MGLADDLGRWLRHEPIRARRANSVERSVRWAQRPPAAAALLVLIFAATAASIGVFLHDIHRNRETITAITKERNEATKSAKEAIVARNEATKSEKEAIVARNEARREAKQNLRRLVRVAVDNGNRLVEEGSPLLALPWYVHALKNEPDGALAETRHRIRPGSVLSTVPGLTRLEINVSNSHHPTRSSASNHADSVPAPKGQRVTRRVVSHDGKQILLASAPARDFTTASAEQRRGTATVWDAASGKPVFPPLTLR